MRTAVTEHFEQQFGQPAPFVVRAPGRVNLIGEHTDYNDGFVLPMAIDRATWIALRPRRDREVHIHTLNFKETAVVHLDVLERKPENGWIEYVKGMAWVLQQAGFALTGWEGVLGSDIPIGAGLSSSAALDLSLAYAWAAVSGWEWQPVQMAQLSQQADNEWVGVQCGIMDQMISATGQADHALLLDCRSLARQFVPLPPETAVVILDTSTRRGLVDSAYNERRRQCEAAAQFFNVPALRDVALTTFTAQAHQLDAVTRRRARHVITENDRTLKAAEAMRAGDAVALGQLMNQSHLSLRDDFEVSSPELNTIVELAQAQEGCYGARMTGAGFGGCAVALVQADQAQAVVTAVSQSYHTTTHRQPHLYICTATEGASLVSQPG